MHPKYYRSGRKPVYHKPFEGESGGGGALDAHAAADAFAALDAPDEPAPAAAADEAAPTGDGQIADDADDADDQGDEQDDADADDDGAITIEVDGKSVTLTREELAEAYKSGLRNKDYTVKTMEAAEAKKQAEAETQKARQERDNYAQKLAADTAAEQRILEDAATLLTDELLESDPQEFLRLQRTLQQRQAKLQQGQAELQQLTQARQQEHEQAVKTFQQEQHAKLLAKLPEWKDPAKANAEAGKIKDYLLSQEFTAEELAGLADHRLVLLARKAMQLEQITSKAKEAAKKVAALPPKVERPGSKNVRPTDGRTTAMKRLSSTGSIDDAAAAFSLL